MSAALLGPGTCPARVSDAAASRSSSTVVIAEEEMLWWCWRHGAQLRLLLLLAMGVGEGEGDPMWGLSTRPKMKQSWLGHKWCYCGVGTAFVCLFLVLWKPSVLWARLLGPCSNLMSTLSE